MLGNLIQPDQIRTKRCIKNEFTLGGWNSHLLLPLDTPISRALGLRLGLMSLATFKVAQESHHQLSWASSLQMADLGLLSL